MTPTAFAYLIDGSLVIREFADGDYERFTMANASQMKTASSVPGNNEYQRRESIDSALRRAHATRLVAERDGQIVGAVAFAQVNTASIHGSSPQGEELVQQHPTVVYVWDLGSIAGAGAALLARVMDAAREAGVGVCLAFTNGSRAFYSRLGARLISGLAYWPPDVIATAPTGPAHTQSAQEAP